MPPAKTSTTTDAPPAEKDPLEGLSDDNANPAVHDLLVNAQALTDERDAIYKKIQANRDILRNYKQLGMLSEKQSKSIDLFYPPRESRKGTAKAEG